MMQNLFGDQSEEEEEEVESEHESNRQPEYASEEGDGELEPEGEGEAEVEGPGEAEVESEGELHDDVDPVNGESEGEREQSSQEVEEVAEQREESEGKDSESDEKEEHGPRVATSRRRDVTESGSERLEDNRYADNEDDEVDQAGSHRSLEEEEAEVHISQSAPEIRDVFGESDDEEHAEYAVENNIENDANRSPMEEEGSYEKDLRPEDMLADEEGRYESEEDNMESKFREKPVGPPLELEIPLQLPPAHPEKMNMIKVSNIMGVDSKPFDPKTFVDEDKLVTDEGGQRRIRLENNIVRWRPVRKADGTTSYESNARFVRWSDGSLQLQIGIEVLDISVQDAQHDQAHLFLRHGKGILQSQGGLLRKMRFMPSSLTSNSHRLLTALVDSRHKKSYKVKNCVTDIDPEREKEQKERAESQTIRANELLSRKKEKVNRKYTQTVRRERQLSPGFLEDALEEEEGDGELEPEGEGEAEVEGPGEAEVESEGELHDDVDPVNGESEGEREQSSQEVEEVAEQREESEGKDSESDEKEEHGPRVATSRRRDVTESGSERLEDNRYADNEDDEVDQAGSHRSLEEEEAEVHISQSAPEIRDVFGESDDEEHAEYAVENNIENDANRSPMEEEGSYEKDLRPEDMLADEEGRYESEEDNMESKFREKPVGPPLELEIPLQLPPAHPEKMNMIKVSNIMGVDSKPFDPKTFVDEDKLVTDEGGQRRIRLENNIVRWRPVRKADGTTSYESNARFVRWSDGSLQLQIGIEVLDISVQDAQHDQAHLFLRHGKGILQSQGGLLRKMRFMPSSLTSNSHRLLTALVDSRHKKSYKVKNCVTDIDPEREKEQKERAESQTIRANELLSRKKEKVNRKYTQTVRRERQLSPGFLEDALEEEEGDGELEPEGEGEAEVEGPGEAEVESEGELHDDVDPVNGESEGEREQSSQEVEEVAEQREESEGKDSESDEKEEHGPRVATSRRRDVTESGSERLEDNRYADNEDDEVDQAGSHRSLEEEEAEVHISQSAPEIRDVFGESDDEEHAEYAVENNIENDANRSPMEEEGSYEKDLRPEDMLADEEGRYESEEDNMESKFREKPVGPPLELEIPLQLPPAHPEKMNMIKVSNIMGVDSKPFDPKTFVDEDKLVTDEGGQRRIRLENNIVRWRPVRKADGTTSYESNARFVRWSDGSLQLQIGIEVLDISVQDAQHDQAHLFLRHGKGILQSQGGLLRKMRFMPSSLTSNSHRLLTALVDSRHKKSYKVKNCVTDIDPEREKEQKERAESQTIRANELLSRKKEKVNRKYTQTVRRERQLSPGFLEDALEEEEEADYYDPRRSATRRRFEEDLEMEARAEKRIINAKKGQRDAPRKSSMPAAKHSRQPIDFSDSEKEESEYETDGEEDEKPPPRGRNLEPELDDEEEDEMPEEEDEDDEVAAVEASEEEAEERMPKAQKSHGSLKRKEIESDEDSPPRKTTAHRRMAVVYDSDED